MKVRLFCACACAVLVIAPALAHGPQIQITVDSNKINTRNMLFTEPYPDAGLTSPKSLYVMPVLPVTFVGQPVARVKPSAADTFGPGFTYGWDQTVGSTRLFTANLNLHVDGLQIWNGSSFVPTGSEQLGLLQSSSNVNPDTVPTTALGGNLAIAISATYNSTAHSSVRYQLLGNGTDPYSSSRDAIYLATLQLNGTQSPNLTPSDTFYYILSKNVSPGALDSVVNGFAASRGISAGQIQYASVPEPSMLLINVGLAIWTINMRRNRR